MKLCRTVLRLTLSWTLCSFFGLAVPVKSHSQDIIHGAKKEGKFLLYTSLTLQEIDEVAGPFTKKYPFLKVESFRGNALQLLQKITTEARAGRPQADVAQFNSFEAWQLQKLGLLQSYKSPEAKKFPDNFKDPDGYWTILYMNYLVLGYNPTIVSAADVPKTWDDLLHPRWKGDKFALDRDNAVWYGGLALYWGKEKAAKFMKALASQQPTMRKGHTLIANLMSSGEFPLGLVYAHRVEEMKSKGMNTIEWVALEPIVATPIVIGIAKNAPSPNAAKLFVDFFLSKEGQVISQKQQFRVPANPDMPPVSAKLDAKNLKISLINRQLADSYQEYDKEYQALFK
ncbi:MAG TPA: extracellular solute-binding protein [Candidatus Nitrosocosmicus sp.]|nr:extracellular solute-binding protein [Candidatus Nitrosocosmicus sp.]